MDSADGGAVVGRICSSVVLEELRDFAAESSLEERDTGFGSGSRVLGDQGEGRMGRPQCAGEKLGTEHGEVVGQGEDF